MLKVKNGIASREPIPHFLVGLSPESLADLSWTDPQLGVQDCAWWPEEDATPVFDPDTEKLGPELMAPNAERKVVLVSRVIIPLTAEEIAERTAAHNAAIQAQIANMEAQIAVLQGRLK